MSLPTLLVILIIGLTAIAPSTVAADDNTQDRYSEYSDKADQLIRNG